MIDWEGSFDLEALASQMKTDAEDGTERRRQRSLEVLQRRGMMEFELDDDAGTDLFDDGDTSEDDVDTSSLRGRPSGLGES